VTDIAILVVAADDGIMPQSIEAIDHIRNAKVPMIVAVNKIDKPGSNPDKVLQQLMQHNVVVESYGGDTISVPVSALTGEGVPNLLELILLQAEVMELKADPKGEVDGVVVEAKLDKGRGPVCTLLVMSGTLKIGDSIVVGQCHGKIKAMTDYTGERMNAAGPSTPVEVLGLNEVPSAGDRIIVAADERAARNLAEERAMKARSKQLDGGRRRMSLKDLRKHLDDGEMRSLNLVVKADVQGSVEAVKGLLEKVANEEVEVKVVAANVGSITESDVLLASASDAIIVGFNAKPEGKAKAEAEKHRVEIRTYSIIYELIEDIEAAVKGMLAPKFEEQARGSAEIRAVFKLTKAGFVAGSYVTEGTLKRGGECRVFRNKELVYTGKVDSLKHIKADVREMNMGQECGIQFDGWTAFQEGDIVEAFEMVQIMD
jgi:translation initiation factor IF-2